MALPKIEVPTYELTLPSRDEKIGYRPFTVKEEKILMIASESENQNEIYNAITKMINACTFDKLDSAKLPLFDIEYIFLQIRSKSVGEIAKFRVVCPDDLETYADVEVDISKVDVHVDDDHTNKIMLDESRNLGVVFGYPTLGVTRVAKNITDAKTEDIFDIIYSCVDHIFEGEKIYPAKDTSKKEMIEFFDSISQENLVDIKKFFDTMPQLKHTLEVENPKTKVKSEVTFRGLSDFFPYASPTAT
tara:strand:- start:122 stop:859 length:738 start_codon:yes stop_codon:yes gene_type:complete